MNFKKGTITLLFAWAYVLLAGYAYSIWLATRFGPELYGDYVLVMYVLTWIQIVVINGLPYAVQKFVAANETKVYHILNTAIRLQLIASVVLFVIAFACSPLLAGLCRDPRLTPFLRVVFIDLLFYGFFHLFVSFQNGLRRFGRQAVLFVIYATSKLILGILLVEVTQSLIGAFMANFVASVVSMGIGYGMLGKGETKPLFEWRPLVRFALPSVGYFLLLNLLTVIDLVAVKIYLVNVESGYYGVASLLGKSTYFLFFALSTTVLPTLSVQLSAHDGAATVRKTVQQAIRLLLVITIPVGIFTTVYSHEIIAVLFPDFLPAGSILRILIWGMLLKSVLALFTTIFNADHRLQLSCIIVAIAVLIDIIMNILLVPRYGGIGGAVSTTVAASVGLIVSAVFIYRRFRVLIGLTSMIKLAGASLLLYLILDFFKVHGPLFILCFVGGMGFFMLLLFLFKEIRLSEIHDFIGFGNRKNLKSLKSESFPMDES